MESIEQSGRTVEEAVNTALEALGVTRDQVNIEIIAHESRGLLGILGTPARVRVTLKSAAAEQAPAAEEAEPEPEPEEDEAPEKYQDEEDEEEERPQPAPSGPVTASELGERACEILTRILALMGTDATPELIADDEEGVQINLHTEEDMGLLIGRRGQTLSALQLLVAMMANRPLPPEERRRIILDVEGYRERREIALRSLARNSADRAKRSGRPVRLEALNPRERRIVHLALADDPAVTTRSEGEDPNRVIVIVPRRSRGRR